jgi:hypothetical protein
MAAFTLAIPINIITGDDICDMQVNFRELTREELRDMKRLAADECANYDRQYGCLLLDGKCYMFYGVAFTCSALCKYYRRAVMPLNPRLVALFNGENIAEHIKCCAVCGKELYSTGNRAKYCEPCGRRVHRRQKNESDRKRRSKTDK